MTASKGLNFFKLEQEMTMINELLTKLDEMSSVCSPFKLEDVQMKENQKICLEKFYRFCLMALGITARGVDIICTEFESVAKKIETLTKKYDMDCSTFTKFLKKLPDVRCKMFVGGNLVILEKVIRLVKELEDENPKESIKDIFKEFEELCRHIQKTENEMKETKKKEEKEKEPRINIITESELKKIIERYFEEGITEAVKLAVEAERKRKADLVAVVEEQREREKEEKKEVDEAAEEEEEKS